MESMTTVFTKVKLKKPVRIAKLYKQHLAILQLCPQKSNYIKTPV